MLSEANSIEEIKEIIDKAEAVRHYLKVQKLGLEAVNKAAEIRIRAERKLGIALRDMEKNKGGNPNLPTPLTPKGVEDAPTNEELGITKWRSHRTQTIVEVPETEFEAAIAQTKDEGKELTSASNYRLGRDAKEDIGSG